MGTADNAAASEQAPSKKRRKGKNLSPETQFHHALAACSRTDDLTTAIALYDSAAAAGYNLSAHHFNTLLHIFGNAAGQDPAATAGAAFRIFDRMLSSGIHPTEATVTSMARVAACDEVGGGGDKAFELVKEMGNKYGLSPKLRTYGPALFAFCKRAEDVNKAYAVEEHMVEMGILPEEQELAALLKVSAEAGQGDKVYNYMQKLRSCIGCINQSTAEIIEHWFKSEAAAEIGREHWDIGQVNEAILMNGGGYHGEGWLGKGRWSVNRSKIGLDGRCDGCWELLASVDIGVKETEKFAESVASLALERELHSNFRKFQDWLDNHADYEAIVDGANIALYQQNFADGGFSFSQIESVVKELLQRYKGKRPLVVLHKKRLQALMANPSNRQALEVLRTQGALYETPTGSNDDWYWLYAAIKLKCLLVTNDEMRDHIFELIGSKVFPKWKDTHQVRYTFNKGQLKLEMPPSYTSIIQESSKGSWHVPLSNNCDEEKSTSWLCICRVKECHGQH